MGFAKLAPVLALAFGAAALATAEEAAPAPAAQAEAAPAAEAATPDDTLGPVGHDSQGRPGRIHIVKPGDTLWDISDAYLGTPWVWPSIWTDNTAEVENPHRIYPNERIWISPHEMRKVSDAEADQLLANEPQAAPIEEPMPAAIADPDGPEPVRPRSYYRYGEIQTTGFVTMEELEGAATIIAAPNNRAMLTDHTPVDIGLGQSEVAVGDQLDIFRTGDTVIDPSNGKDMGKITVQLGWLEITSVSEESAIGVIRLSRSEILRGDHVMPRRMRSADIPIGDKPQVEGVIAHTPNKRVQMGQGDVIYLNRGTSEGLEVGSPVEVYEARDMAFDSVRKEQRALADRVLAKAIVVDVYDRTAVAVVTHTNTELNRGFKFRGSDSIAP